MAADSEVFFSRASAGTTVTSSWQDLESITFTPTALTKFVATAYGQQEDTSLADPDQCWPSNVGDWAVTVDGTTVCELNTTSGVASMIWFGELSIASHTIVLRGKSSYTTNQMFENTRLAVFGVEEWEIVEQGADPTTEIIGTETRLNKILMQHIFHPKTTDALVLTYGEVQPNPGSADEHVGLKVYFDQENNTETTLLDTTHRKSSSDCWVGVASAERMQLAKGEHHLVFSTQSFSGGGDEANFRRLRCALIPLSGNPFVVSAINQFKDRTIYTGTENTAGVTTNVLRTTHQTFAGLTYMVLGSMRSGPSHATHYGHVTMRYRGLGITGSSTDFDTVTRDDLMNFSTARLLASSNELLPISGQQAVSFHVHKATVDSSTDEMLVRNGFDQILAPSALDTHKSAMEHRNLMLLQFQQAVGTATDSATPTPKERYSSHTLVEISKPLDIHRYSTSDDIYLMDGVTSSELVTKIQSGDIDEASVINSVVTGQQVIDAINAGATVSAASLLDLDSGMPEGVTTSPVSEHFTFSSLNRLYKRGVAKSIKLATTAPDAYFGVVGVEKASISFANNDSEFTDDHDLEDLFGCDLKIMNYDTINKTLYTRFNGKIIDVEASDTIKVTAINPNMDVLDTEIPTVIVSDLARDDSFDNDILLSPDNPEAVVPLFFGKARRTLAPSAGKSFGDTTTDPDWLNSFADYAIGGPLLASQYRSVIFDDEFVERGIYRGWLGVTATEEFEDGSDVVSFDKYAIEGKPVPVVRFASFIITTSVRTGPLALPHPVADHGVDVGLATPYNLYPAFTPVSKFLSAIGYVEGRDWQTHPNNSDGITFLPALTSGIDGATQPSVFAAGVTTGTFSRQAGTSANKLAGSGFTDTFTGATTTAQFTQVTAVVGVSQTLVDISDATIGYMDFTEGDHYTVASTNRHRSLEDKINWSPIKDKRGEWKFNGDINDSVATNHLTGDDSQPTYNSAKTALEAFGTAGLGTVSILHAGITPTTQLDFSPTEDFRLTAYVSQNGAGELEGTVARRSTGTTDGFILDIQSEDTFLPAGGDADKYVARARLGDVGLGSYDTLYSASITTGIQLNDGNIHKIDLLVKRDFASADRDYSRLMVDDIMQDSELASLLSNQRYELDGAGDLVIGGSAASTGDFKGLIHNVVLAEDGEGDPEEGVDYSIDWTYIRDSYEAIWEYNNVVASNPVPVGSNIFPIGYDMKVAGCDTVPTAITSTVPLMGSTTMSWVQGPGDSGYAVRFNFSNPESAWNLGTSGLDETTFLGGVPGDKNGRVEFDDVPALMTHEGDFTVYFYGVWRGDVAEDSIAVAKETSTNSKPSYALGMAGGKAFGSVRVNGSMVDIGTAASGAESLTPADSKVPVYMQLERAGATLNLYLNGQLEATRACGKSLSSDFDSSDLVVASNAIYSQRWVGDISFFGILDYAGGLEFAKMQLDLMSRGIKGGFCQELQGENSDFEKNTTIHVPFIEGTGTSIKNRNLHRNYVQTIKRVLSDPITGAGERVDGLNFDLSTVILDDLELKCDFAQATPRKLSDILNDLGMVRGMTVKKTATGKWKILVDDSNTVVAAKFGQGDGVFNNIVNVKSLKHRSSDEAVKDVRIEYRQFHDTEGNLNYHSFVERNVLPYGASKKVYQNPYILDHKTADKVADYLGKKLRVASKVLNITVGQEGMPLKYGNLVEISIPRLNITSEIFQVAEVSSDGITVQLTLNGYSAQIFDYDPGPLPGDENIIASTGR